MNKYQKALETFNKPCYFGMLFIDSKSNEEVQQDFILLKELVERATPKEILETEDIYLVGECPACLGNLYIRFNYNFCPHCGQALTMKKEETK